MERAKARRRRLALGVLAGLAAAAFALGAALGDSPAPEVGGRQHAADPAAGRRADRRRHRRHRGSRRAWSGRFGEGRVAGVVLFADNFPSRAAGRRLIAGLQAIRRPPALRDPLLVMIDQEGGLVKRVGGAPTASAAEMGARGGAFSREQGRRTAANLRELGVNVDLAPVLDVARPGRHDRRDRTRLWLDRRAGRRDRGPVRRGPAGGRGGGNRQALPRPRGRAAKTPTSRCSGSASRSDAAGGRRGSLPAPSSPPAATW